MGLVNSEAPGPGNYEPPSTIGIKSKGFTIAGRKEEKYSENPGPGQYYEKDTLTKSKSQAGRIGTS